MQRPFVDIFAAGAGQVEIADPYGDCLRQLVAPVRLLLLGKRLELFRHLHFLSALDDEECLVENCPVDEEVLFPALHLDVEEPPAACCREDVEDDLLLLGYVEGKGLVETETQRLDSVVPLEVQDSVEEVLQRVLVAEQRLERRVVCRVEVDLPGEFRGYGVLADRLVGVCHGNVPWNGNPGIGARLPYRRFCRRFCPLFFGGGCFSTNLSVLSVNPCNVVL